MGRQPGTLIIIDVKVFFILSFYFIVRDSVKHHARQTHGGGLRGYEPKIKFANNAMYTSHWKRRELYRSLVYVCKNFPERLKVEFE